MKFGLSSQPLGYPVFLKYLKYFINGFKNTKLNIGILLAEIH